VPKVESVPVIFVLIMSRTAIGSGGAAHVALTTIYRSLAFTVTYLRDSLQVHNLIYAFSPDGNQFRYPGRIFTRISRLMLVDIFGTDFYFWESGTDVFSPISAATHLRSAKMPRLMESFRR